jgi:hypothetical protein
MPEKLTNSRIVLRASSMSSMSSLKYVSFGLKCYQTLLKSISNSIVKIRKIAIFIYFDPFFFFFFFFFFFVSNRVA